jgi:hypothetical protein
MESQPAVSYCHTTSSARAAVCATSSAPRRRAGAAMPLASNRQNRRRFMLPPSRLHLHVRAPRARAIATAQRETGATNSRLHQVDGVNERAKWSHCGSAERDSPCGPGAVIPNGLVDTTARNSTLDVQSRQRELNTRRDAHILLHGNPERLNFGQQRCQHVGRLAALDRRGQTQRRRRHEENRWLPWQGLSEGRLSDASLRDPNRDSSVIPYAFERTDATTDVSLSW